MPSPRPLSRTKLKRLGPAVVELHDRLAGLGLPVAAVTAPALMWRSSPRSFHHFDPACRRLRGRPVAEVFVALDELRRTSRCPDCGRAPAADRWFPNGVDHRLVQALVEDWGLDEFGLVRESRLVAARDRLSETAVAGTPLGVAQLELAACVDAELARVRAGRVAAQAQRSQLPAGEAIFAVTALFGAGSGLVPLLAEHDLVGPSSSPWALVRPIVGGVVSGLSAATPAPATLDEALACAGRLFADLTAAERVDDLDHAGQIPVTSRLGARLAELLAAELASGAQATVAATTSVAWSAAVVELCAVAADAFVAALTRFCAPPGEQMSVVRFDWAPAETRDEMSVAYGDMLCARFPHVLDADGKLTVAAPSQLVPSGFVSRPVRAVACPDGFDPSTLAECVRLAAHLTGPFPARFAAAAALITAS